MNHTIEETRKIFLSFVANNPSLAQKNMPLFTSLCDLIEAHRLLLERIKAQSRTNRFVVHFSQQEINIFADHPCDVWSLDCRNDDFCLRNINDLVSIGTDGIDEILRSDKEDNIIAFQT